MRHVIYAAVPQGYAVNVIEGGEVVEEYMAGNSRYESQTYVDPKDGLPLATLKKMAKGTASEFSNIGEPVEYDSDLEDQLRELFSEH